MNITIVGSTGSIGTQTLDVARRQGIHITALTAHRNTALLERQVREFDVPYVAVADEKFYADLKTRLADRTVKILAGAEGIAEIAAIKADRMVNAAVGIAGLQPTEAAIKAGNAVALANKETLVAGGEYIMRLAEKNGVPIFPVDSEHSAVFQCLAGNRNNTEISKIILTCSGGAFFGKTKAELENITPGDISNPNWDMGAKVTLDSATLANKGLECIEAARLFGVDEKQIEVVIHRESIVHSAVEFTDGAVIAELGMPDMRLPIQYALTFPERLPCPVKPLSLADMGSLSFFKPDYETFEALPAFLAALRKGGGAPAIANAVNEAAGRLFLDGKIPFLTIGKLLTECLSLPAQSAETMAEIYACDALGREFVQKHTTGF